MDVQGLRVEAQAAYRGGYALVAVSCMFLAAFGWWGHAGRYWESITAAVAAWLLAWCAGGELRHARILEEQADQTEWRLLTGADCCCGLSTIPTGAHFAADEHRMHTESRCQDLREWAGAGGVL